MFWVSKSLKYVHEESISRHNFKIVFNLFFPFFWVFNAHKQTWDTKIESEPFTYNLSFNILMF